MTSKVQSFDCLSAAQCAQNVETILDFREKWIPRKFFYTLGASTYLDPPMEYYQLVGEENAFLKAIFSPLLEAVRATLQDDVFKRPVKFHPFAALPGIHVFTDSANGHSGSVHVDQPYQRVFWPEPFFNPFSFTVPLALPEVGGGLNLHSEEEPHEVIDFVPYEVGKLYAHSGLFMHSIANCGDLSEDEYRITVQGHGAFLQFSETIVIYF